jgi:hypothetical protein
MQPTMQPSSLPTLQPTVQPSSLPSSQPSSTPSLQPTAQPSRQPTHRPSSQPSSQPTAQPTNDPTMQPTVQPSTQPTAQPSSLPSQQPSSQPTSLPTLQPTVQPSSLPTTQPSSIPTSQPSVQPSALPTGQPSAQPSSIPSAQPSAIPTGQPSVQPSARPTQQPSAQPTLQPTVQPTMQPSAQPSSLPSSQPTAQPTSDPTQQPTVQPSSRPTSQPSVQPTKQPSSQPSSLPTLQPTVQPTMQPTAQPSGQPSAQPSIEPTSQPSTQPSVAPTSQPSAQPSSYPTPIPSQFTALPDWKVRLAETIERDTVSLDSGITQLLYSELVFDYKFVKGYGGCSSWKQFASRVELKNALEIKKVTSVSLSTTKLMYDYYKIHDPSPAPKVCRNESIAEDIVQRLAYSATTETGNFSVSCNNSVWQIKNCKREVPSMCVDCVDPCEVHCSNNRDVNFVSSCVVDTAYCRDVFGARNGLKYFFNILAVNAVDREGAPAILAATVTPQRTSAAVQVQLQHLGGVQCAVFPASNPLLATLPASLDDIRAQGIVQYATTDAATAATAAALDSQVNVTVTLPKLLAATDYRLYCFSFDASGQSMSLQTMMQSYGVQLFTTACCKEIEVTLSSNVVRTSFSSSVSNSWPSFSSSSSLEFLKITLSAAPSSDLTVLLTTTPTDGTGEQVFFPDTLSFSASEAVLTRSVAFRAAAYTSGTTYSVVASVGGTSATEYGVGGSGAVVFTGGVDSFTVLDASASAAEPAAPQLLSAVFSPSGDLLTVRFTGPTDRGFGSTDAVTTVFACADVLSWTGISEDLLCRWDGDATLVVFSWGATNLLSASFVSENISGIDAYNAAEKQRAAGLQVGQDVSLNGNTLKALCYTATFSSSSCSTWSFAPSNTVTVTASSQVLSPTIVVTAPRTISKCDDFLLDVSGSNGFAGALLSNVSVLVQSADASTASLAAVQGFLQSKYAVYAPVAIPGQLFDKGAEYLFVVSGCSRGAGAAGVLLQAGCASAVHTLSVSNFSTPVAWIEGEPFRTVFPDAPVRLQAQALAHSDCSVATAEAPENLQYTWLVKKNNIVQSEFQSYSKNPLVFSLPPYVLSAGSTYYVYLTVLDSVTGVSSFTYIVLYVESANIVALLTGSSSRALSVGQSILLSAGGSYDANDGLTSSEKLFPFTFTWSCLTIAPVVADTCSGFAVSAVGSDGSILRIEPLLPNITATFTITLRDEVNAYSVATSNRTSTASVTLYAVPSADIAQIRVEVYAADNSKHRAASGGMVVNAADTLKLVGSIFVPQAQQAAVNAVLLGDASALTASWGVNDTSLDLSALTLSSCCALELLPLLARNLGAPATSGTTAIAFNVVLPAQQLVSGASYLFTLSMLQFGNTSSAAGFLVKVNAAPASGTLFVSPSSGTALTTSFSLQALQWIDSDLPLRYQFGYLAPSAPVSPPFAFDSSASEQSLESQLVPVSSLLELNYVTTPLPALRRGSAATVATTAAPVYVAVLVHDMYDARTAATQAVSVTQASVNPVVGRRLFLAVRDYFAGNVGDSRKLMRSVAVFSGELNGISCALSAGCSAYNRYNCSTVTNTCGECVTGYIGVAGSDNSPCILLNATSSTSGSGSSRMMMESRNPYFTKVEAEAAQLHGTECTRSSECEGVFEQCVQQHCVVPQKTCPTAVAGSVCSGHGSCMYFDSAAYTSSSDVVASCAVDSVFCVAKCVCNYEANNTITSGKNANYYGDACQLSELEYTFNTRTRALIAETMYNLTEFEDFTSVTLRSWAALAQSIALRPAEFDETALSHVLLLAQLVAYGAEQSANDGDPVESASIVLALNMLNAAASSIASAQNFDAFVQGFDTTRTNSATALVYARTWLPRLEQALQALLFYASSDMIEGQAALQQTWSDLRLSVQLLPLLSTYSNISAVTIGATDTSTSIELQQTGVELATGTDRASVSVPLLQNNVTESGVVAIAYSLNSRLFTDSELLNQSVSYGYSQAHLLLRSDPLKLIFSSLGPLQLGLNCSSGGGDATGGGAENNGCAVQVVLQHNVFTPFIEPYENITYTTCYDQDYYVADYSCLTAPGTNLTVACSQDAGVVVDRCPIYNITSVCNTLLVDSNETASAAEYGASLPMFNFSSCSVVSFTASNVTCSCLIAQDAAAYGANVDENGTVVSYIADAYAHPTDLGYFEVQPSSSSSSSSSTDDHLGAQRYLSGAKKSRRKSVRQTAPARRGRRRRREIGDGYQYYDESDEDIDADSARLRQEEEEDGRALLNFTTVSVVYAAQARVYTFSFDRQFRPSDYQRSPYTSIVVFTSMSVAAVLVLLLGACSFGTDVVVNPLPKTAKRHKAPAVGDKKPSKKQQHPKQRKRGHHGAVEAGAGGGGGSGGMDRSEVLAFDPYDDYEVAELGDRESYSVRYGVGRGNTTNSDAAAMYRGNPASPSNNPYYSPAVLEEGQRAFNAVSGAIATGSGTNGMGSIGSGLLTRDSINSTLPPILQRDSEGNQRGFAAAFWDELKVHHRWLSILAHKSDQYPRLLRIVALVFQVITPVFICTILLMLLDPDDGTCEKIDNQRDCIADPNGSVSGYNKCIWYTSDQSCGFRQPQQPLYIVAMIVLIASLLATPVARYAEFGLMRISTCVPSVKSPWGWTGTGSDGGAEDPLAVALREQVAVSALVASSAAAAYGSSAPTSPDPRDTRDPRSPGSGAGELYSEDDGCMPSLWGGGGSAWFGSSGRGAVGRGAGWWVPARVQSGPVQGSLGSQGSQGGAAGFTIDTVYTTRRRGGVLQQQQLSYDTFNEAMYDALDPSIVARYPWTLAVRRYRRLPVPVRFQPVQFIDGVSVDTELDILLSRLGAFTDKMLATNKMAQFHAVTSKSHGLSVSCS